MLNQNPSYGEVGLPDNDRIYTLDELLKLFGLSGDSGTELMKRIPHSTFGPTTVFSGNVVVRTLAAWGIRDFLCAVNCADRVSDRVKP